MSKKTSIEEFLRRSKLSQGDKYDYSKVLYVNQYSPVIIICPIHGEFQQIPKSHMLGFGCKKCSDDKSVERYTGVKKINRLDRDMIISRLKILYKNYDYADCYITGTRHTAIINDIICPIHGYFSKGLNNHMRQKQGCNLCGSKKLSIDDFTNRSNIIHQRKYDYSKFKYSNDRTKSTIICPIHGEFEQDPVHHLRGPGCSTCQLIASSKGDAFIHKFLTENNIKFESQKIIPGSTLKMDFYLPDYNMCIEYDGIQHFQPVKQFGGDIEYKIIVARDSRKNEYCSENNIRLVRIGYKDYHKLHSILTTLLIKENRILMKHLKLFENFNSDILHIFDFDDTLVKTPTFEELSIEFLKENVTIKDMLLSSVDKIGVKLSNIKCENGRLFIEDPHSKIDVYGNWVRKRNRIYLVTPHKFPYTNISLPKSVKELSTLYNSVENKCIVTARPEDIRDKILESMKKLGLKEPNYGLYMFPSVKGSGNPGTWKGNKIVEILIDTKFKKAHFYDDNSKTVNKVERIVKQKLPNVDLKVTKVKK